MAEIGEREASASSYGAHAGITALDVLVVLAKHKRIVFGLPAAAGILAIVVLLLLPNIYTATARIMPPQQAQSAGAAALSALAGVTGMGGAVSALGLKNPNDLYVGILKSNTVADRIIDRFRLKQRFDTETLVHTREALADVTTIRAGRDGLIVIEVDDTDPQIAADMANAYAEELDRLTQKLAVTEASQRRLFFERELLNVKQKLAESEKDLLNTQEKTGLIQPEGQARAIFDAFADLRARIAAKEVEIASLRTFATSENPTYKRAHEELTSLRQQLARLESSRPEYQGKGNILVPTSAVPEASLEFVRKMRDLKYNEALYDLHSKQYELAKIEESKDAGIIQMVDRATPPDYKSKPKRALLLILVLFGTGVLSILGALLLEALRTVQNSPEHTKIDELLAYLRGGAKG